MADGKTEDTLVIIKPDSFWRNLNGQVEARLKALGLTVVAERTSPEARTCRKKNGGNFIFRPSATGLRAWTGLRSIWLTAR